MWEDRQLNTLEASDIREVVQSGLQEHSQLDYKANLDEDKKEFLLDICQFANASGGILLVGIPELRENGKPTGIPDPNAELGIEATNAEAELLKLDSWIASGIAETLHIESHSIKMAENRNVFAIRVPNSTIKPHSVYLDKGHIYFPYRRERSRDYLDVRDIKEMVMRTASRVEQAEEQLKESFLGFQLDDDQPRLMIGIIPAFHRDFMLKINDRAFWRARVFFWNSCPEAVNEVLRLTLSSHLDR